MDSVETVHKQASVSDLQNISKEPILQINSENKEQEFIEQLLSFDNVQLDVTETLHHISTRNDVHKLMSHMSRMPQEHKEWNQNLTNINYEEAISPQLLSHSDNSDEIRSTQSSYSVMNLLSDAQFTDSVKAFITKNCEIICLHALAVFHPLSKGNTYHARVVLETLLNNCPEPFITILTEEEQIQPLFKCALFRNLHQGNLNAFVLDLLTLNCVNNDKMQSSKHTLMNMFVEWKFVEYILKICSDPKHTESVCITYGAFVIDMLVRCAPVQEASILFEGNSNLIMDTFMNAFVDEDDIRSICHRVYCAQVLIQYFDIICRAVVIDETNDVMDILNLDPDPSPNILYPLFEESVQRLYAFIPLLCDMIANKKYTADISLACGIISKPLGQIRLSSLELLSVCVDSGLMCSECSHVLRFIEIEFWELLLNMTFIHKRNNLFLSYFRQLIHLVMVYKRGVLEHLFLKCKMLQRFVDFYHNDIEQRTALHSYIVQILWDIYSQDTHDEDHDEKNIKQENEWDIVSFFDASKLWNQFRPTVSLEMKHRNDQHENEIPENIQSNQQQLDQLLCGLLSAYSVNDDGSSSDSD